MKPDHRILAKRYARAYLGLDGLKFSHEHELALKTKVSALKKVFSSVAPHRRILVHPAVSGKVKREVLEKIMGPAASHGPAGIFLEFLVKENRFFLFEEIVEAVLRLFEEWCGIKKAEVYSRYDLGSAELARIEKVLGKASGSRVHLSQVVAERVLGGFEIKMGDLLIDATLKGRLERLKRELSAV